MKRKLLALCLTVLLLLGTMSGVRASDSLFFVAVNDDIPLLLPGNTAAYYANGMLYAPYTVFDAAPGGISISFTEDGRMSLFTLGQTVIFDPNEGTMTEKSGIVHEMELIYRGGILYVPVQQAAKSFGLSVSLLTSSAGCPILRFTSGAQKYDDEKFLERSELFVQHMLDEYGGLTSGEISDSTPEEPPEEEKPVYEGERKLYLAFAGDAVSQETLNHLDAYADVRLMHTAATFFLTERQLQENRELVRRIYSSGHTIGLTADETEEDLAAALRAANDAMDQALFTRSLMVLLPEGTIVEESWCVFEEPMTPVILEDVLAKPETMQLMICRTAAGDLLQSLLEYDISLCPLLETTRFAEETSEVPSEAQPE